MKEEEEDKAGSDGEETKAPPIKPILVNRLLQVRFENYSLSPFDDLSPKNVDLQSFQHALSDMSFAHHEVMTDRIVDVEE